MHQLGPSRLASMPHMYGHKRYTSSPMRDVEVDADGGLSSGDPL